MVGFATKPQLALEMLARAHDAGVLHGWVTADEAFGQNRTFRGWLAARGVSFVLATRRDDEAGLDHYQVPGYRAWYAHITLAMLAAAYLAATRRPGGEKGGPATGRDGLIPLSSNEIRRLLANLVLAPAICVSSAISCRTGADAANTKHARAAAVTDPRDHELPLQC